MTTDTLSFGELLAKKREARNTTLRELARQLEVSAAFLSDVENNRKPPLTADRIEKAANILHLSSDEKTQLYNLAGKQRNIVPPDLPDYIIERDYVSAALRTARDLDAGEEEWQRFVEDIKRRKG